MDWWSSPNMANPRLVGLSDYLTIDSRNIPAVGWKIANKPDIYQILQHPYVNPSAEAFLIFGSTPAEPKNQRNAKSQKVTSLCNHRSCRCCPWPPWPTGKYGMAWVINSCGSNNAINHPPEISPQIIGGKNTYQVTIPQWSVVYDMGFYHMIRILER